MRSVRVLLPGLVLLAGCKPDPYRPDAGPPWWKPAPGAYADWDIQLAATPFDISAPRAMYVIDLWDAVPAATPLDYGDGAPLTVPAGAHPTAIADLHARTPPAIVVCQVGTGAIRLDDPDAVKFPGYAGGAPPDRPTVPAADSVIGWSTTDADAGERFIDIHQAARNRVAPLIGKRIELAKTIGCDGIAVKDNDLPAYQGDGQLGHGFAELTFAEYLSWANELRDRAHDLAVSIGSRHRSLLGTDELSGRFDWTIVERCAEYEECDQLRTTFLVKSKAVFEIEYDLNQDGQTNNITTICSELAAVDNIDAIIKSAGLDSSFYMRCP